MNLVASLFSRGDPSPPVWTLLALAAVGVGVAGYLHGRLFWEGYDHVAWVGPLFLLNLIASGVVIALLLVGFPLLFALGGLTISIGAIASILISHSTSFLGFAEHRYDGRATTIVVAEIVAAVLCLVALRVARGSMVAGDARPGVIR
jgi:hypothetical protein